jgi:DNA-binding NarL/FixJ family response regulator
LLEIHLIPEIVMPTSVLLVGCCEVDWLGFRELADRAGLTLEFNAPDQRSALQQLQRSPCDVVLIDAHMPGDGPLSLIEAIKRTVEKQSLMLFALQENPAILASAASMGLLGFVLYSDPFPKIVQKILQAAEGQSSWSRDELRRLALSASNIVPGEKYPIPLTHREKEILKHLVDGGTNKEIAVFLGISYETVKEHIQNILSKVGVNDRSQAAVWAVQHQFA